MTIINRLLFLQANNSSGGDKWAAALPDVVADLSLTDAPGPHQPAMLGTRDPHYLEEPRPRRRDARPPPPPVTPQGLGVAPQGLGASPSQPMMGGSGPAGLGTCGWRHNPQQHGQWVSQPPVDPQSAGAPLASPGLGPGGGCGMSFEGDGARIRSASSEPRGPAGNGGDRRVRCSSATRSRQHRPRPAQGDQPPPAPVSPTPQSGAAVSHGGQQLPYPPSGPQQGAGGMGMVGGVLARLAGCYENMEPGREVGEGVAYGYQVSDLEALLTRASPSRPANLPMVLASATRLHNMRRTPEPHLQNQPPVRPYLPFGIIVNAVFKTRDWLYVRTAHGAEGYVPYRVCLPLGILPPPREGQHASPSGMDVSGTAAWDSRTDMFQGGLAQLPSPPTVPAAVAGLGAVNQEAAVQTRGRSRGRRRPPCPNTSNQTDTQKLQPAVRSLSESRPPRETLDAPLLAPTPFAPTPMALAPLAATPVPTTTAAGSSADHILV